MRLRGPRLPPPGHDHPLPSPSFLRHVPLHPPPHLRTLHSPKHTHAHRLTHIHMRVHMHTHMQPAPPPPTHTRTCAPQTHQYVATRLLDKAARAGQAVEGEVAAALSAEWAQAEKRFREALAYNPDFFDALCALAQLEFDRAKLAAGFVVASPEIDRKSVV